MRPFSIKFVGKRRLVRLILPFEKVKKGQPGFQKNGSLAFEKGVWELNRKKFVKKAIADAAVKKIRNC